MKTFKRILKTFLLIMVLIYINQNKTVAAINSNNSSIVTQEAFTVENFGGNRDFGKTLSLSSSMGYWSIRVKNTGESYIKVGITGEEGVTVVPAGETWIIYNTSKWKEGDYIVTFIAGDGMYGNADAEISNAQFN